MNRHFRIFIALLTFGVFIALCAMIFKDNLKRLAELQNIPAGYLLIASVMFLLNVAARAIFNWLIFRKLGHTVPLADYFVLFYFTTALNFFIPLSGSAYTARYLNGKYNISIADYLGTFGSFNVLLCFASSMFGAIALGISWRMGGSLYAELFFILLSIVIATIAISILRYLRPSSATAVSNRYLGVLDGLMTLCTDITLLILSIVTVLGLILTTFVAIWSLCTGYSAFVDPLQLFLLVISQVLVGIFPLAPGGIGIQESMAVAFGVLMNLDIVELLAIFVLWRFLRMLLLLALLLPARFYLKTHV